MNILVLSAGRRVELIQLLKKAIQDRNINGCIFAADANPLSAALFFSNQSVILPKVTDKSFFDSLIDSLIKFDINLLLPTIDTELDFLSIHKKDIETKTKTRVVVSEIDVVRIFQNKTLACNELNERGFSIPKTYARDNLLFPVFCKPVKGSSSIGSQLITNQDELLVWERMYGELIVQEYLQGEEFTIDCLIDDKGIPLWIVPRIRIATRSGEILKGRVVKDIPLINLCRKLFETFRFFGPITVQVIRRHGIDYIIEINPRVGGGLPFSIYAGADILGTLIDMMLGLKPSYNESFEDGKTFLRYDQTVEYINHD